MYKTRGFSKHAIDIDNKYQMLSHKIRETKLTEEELNWLLDYKSWLVNNKKLM